MSTVTQRQNKWWPPFGLRLGVVVLIIFAIAVTAAYFGIHSSSKPSDSHASSGSFSQPPPVGSGYLASKDGLVVFIQWNDTNGRLKGTAQTANISGQPPNASESTESLPITGTIAGSTISLSFAGSALQFGTLSGPSFTIDAPQSNGTLLPITFTESTSDAYNRAISKLGQGVIEENNATANAQQLQNEEQAISSDAQLVTGDLSTLQQDVTGVSATETPLGGQLKQEKSDLATTASDSSAAERQAGDTSCNPATTAENDAENVENDANNVGTTSDSVESAIQSVRSDVSNVESDYQRLASAESPLPSYGKNLPTHSTVQSLITIALKTISAAIQQTNAVIGQANNFDSTAWQDAGAALQAENCGGAPSPAPISTIS